MMLRNLKALMKKNDRWPVCPEGEGRLDRFLKKYFSAPYGVLMRALRKGDVRVNGRRGSVDTYVRCGDIVETYGLSRSLPKIMAASSNYHEQLQAMCIYDGEDIWVGNKPSGLAVQSGPNIQESLDHWVRVYAESRGEPFWRLAHRLDRQTSGVIICAKNRRSAQEITALFRDQMVQKTYIAVVQGRVEHDGSIDQPIGESASALTHYRVLMCSERYSVLSVRPMTGRKHQIRAHLSAIKHPIMGDVRYGAQASARFFGLHAFCVFLPWRKGFLTWLAPLPAHFDAFVDGVVDLG